MRTIEIAPKTILYTALIIIGLYLIWLTKDLSFSLFLAFIISSGLQKPIAFLQKRNFSRKMAAITVFILFVVSIIGLVLAIVPPIVSETAGFINNFPSIAMGLNARLRSNIIRLDTLGQYVPELTSRSLQLVSNIFTNIFFIISTLFFSFYFLLDHTFITETAKKILPTVPEREIIDFVHKAEKRVGGWLGSEVMLMITVGVLVFIGLQILGISYALPLAVLAGLLEVIPNIGPLISLVPGVIIGFSVSNEMGFIVTILYIVVQLLENNVIVPFIMRHTIGLNPIVTLIALVLGDRLAGVMGMILAVPTVLFLSVVLTEWSDRKAHAANIR